MDVTSDTPPPPPSADPSSSLAVAESEDDSGPLAEKLALATDPSSSLPDRVRLLEEIVKEGDLWSVWCVRVKESAVYGLARAICKTKKVRPSEGSCWRGFVLDNPRILNVKS